MKTNASTDLATCSPSAPTRSAASSARASPATRATVSPAQASFTQVFFKSAKNAREEEKRVGHLLLDSRLPPVPLFHRLLFPRRLATFITILGERSYRGLEWILISALPASLAAVFYWQRRYKTGIMRGRSAQTSREIFIAGGRASGRARGNFLHGSVLLCSPFSPSRHKGRR